MMTEDNIFYSDLVGRLSKIELICNDMNLLENIRCELKNHFHFFFKSILYPSLEK